MSAILISIVIALVIVGFAYWYLSNSGGTPATSTSIVNTIEDGKKQLKSQLDLPRSFNEKEGIAISYTCWVKIDDFSYRYGEQKVIFNKGSEDLKTMCPALLIDANTNSLIVKVDTFGATEVIPIPNIPAKKWLHVAIAIDQDSVDVYINGTLHTHHSLVQLPKQNSSTVTTAIGGGFDGKIANLQYFSYFMKPSDVENSFKTTPQPDPNDIDGPLPPYFDLSFWTR
jgi:hypothetical protein